MTETEEIKAEVMKMKASIEGLRSDNAKLREELASFKKLAVGAMLGEGTHVGRDEPESESPTERRLFWAFVKGLGSVLEIFPPEGHFDRLRIQKRSPASQWASLVRDFWNADPDGENDDTAPSTPGDDAGRENAP